jgi:hypothetical protein
MRLEKRHRATDGFLRSCGGNLAHFEIVRMAAHRARKLGSPGFNSTYDWHVFQCTPNTRYNKDIHEIV